MITIQRLFSFFGRQLKKLRRTIQNGTTTIVVTLNLPPFLKIEVKHETAKPANQNHRPRRRRRG